MSKEELQTLKERIAPYILHSKKVGSDECGIIYIELDGEWGGINDDSGTSSEP